MASRVILKEPLVFDVQHKEETLRVKIDGSGITFWKRAVGNLDAPRPLDKYIHIKWDQVGMAGFCYEGTRTGHEPIGPAMSRVGLHWLTHKD